MIVPIFSSRMHAFGDLTWSHDLSMIYILSNLRFIFPALTSPVLAITTAYSKPTHGCPSQPQPGPTLTSLSPLAISRHPQPFSSQLMTFPSFPFFRAKHWVTWAVFFHTPHPILQEILLALPLKYIQLRPKRTPFSLFHFFHHYFDLLIY